MKKTSILATFSLFLSFVFAVVLGVRSVSATPIPQSTNCFDYQPVAGQQNPPSILQTMDFWANYSTVGCTVYYNIDYYGRYLQSSTVVQVAFPSSGFTDVSGPDFSFITTSPYAYPVYQGPSYGTNVYMDGFRYSPTNIQSTDRSITIANEDAVISGIAATGKLNMRLTQYDPRMWATGYNNFNILISTPATNCAFLSGAGPKKIVFMRSSGWYYTAAEFQAQAMAVRDRILSSKPFSLETSEYSFYIDLQKHNASVDMMSSPSEGASVSSCGADAFQYRFMSNTPTLSNITTAIGGEAVLHTASSKYNDIVKINGSGFADDRAVRIELVSATTSLPAYGVDRPFQATIDGSVKSSPSVLYTGFVGVDFSNYSLSGAPIGPAKDGNYFLKVANLGSGWSNSIPIVIDNTPKPPTNLIAKAVKKGQIELSWTEGQPRGDIGSYIIEMSSVGGTPSRIEGIGVKKDNFAVLSGFKPSSTKVFQVTATYRENGSYTFPPNNYELHAVYTNTATVTTLPPPESPALMATAGENSTAILAWFMSDSADIEGYAVADIQNNIVITPSIQSQGMVVSGLTSGEAYCFVVTSIVNDFNKSDPSNTSCIIADVGNIDETVTSSDPLTAVVGTNNMSLTSSDPTISSVDLVVNGQNVYRDFSAPWNMGFDSRGFQNGSGTFYNIIHRPGKQPIATTPQPITINNPTNTTCSAGYVWSGTSCTLIPTSDTTAPSVPLSLVKSYVAQNNATISWAASTDASGILGYNIYRNGNHITTQTQRTFIDTGLTPSTTYSYTVSATDASPGSNTSSQSAALAVTTTACPSGYVVNGTTCEKVLPADTTPPSTPTGLVSSNITPTSATISWGASTDVSGIARYFVYKNATKIATTTVTTYTETGLAASTTYSYTVSAVDASTNANTSVQSAALSVTTLPIVVSDTTAPTVPTNLVSSSVSTSSLTISWSPSTDASGIWAYNIYKNGVNVKTTATTSYTDTNLTPLTTYTYIVKATDASPAKNVSASSSPLTVTTLPTIVDPNDFTPPTVLSYPAVTKSNITETGATISWTGITDASGIWKYNIYESPYTAPPIESFTNSYTFTGLKRSRVGSYTHSYHIKAVDGSPNHNESTAYKTVSFTTLSSTDATPPTTPTNVTVTSARRGETDSSFLITTTWDPSTDPSGILEYNLKISNPNITNMRTVLGSTTEYTFISSLPNTTYTVEMSAIDASPKHNTSPTSTPVSVTTSISRAIPLPPPTPTPVNLVLNNTSTSSVTFSWDRSSSYYDILYYNIYRDGSRIGTTSANTYTDKIFARRTAHSYTVSAVDNSSSYYRTAQSAPLVVAPAILAIITPVGPITNKTTGHIYYFLPGMKYADAERAATELGGHLVTIDDEAENNFVAAICRGYDGGRYLDKCFIGLNTTSTYTNWSSGQPDESGTSAVVYIDADTATTSYYWADEYSTVQARPSVVELTSAAKAAAPVLQKVSTTNVISATTPIDFSASVTQGSILLSWNNNNIANIYRMEIERATGNSTTFYHIADASAGSTSFNDTRITTNTAYKYRIRIKFTDGTFGDYTPVVSLTSAVAVNDMNTTNKSLLSSVIDAVRGLWGW